MRLASPCQQIQKYERGANRIGASRLWDLAQALDVPVSFFFDDMAPGVAGTSPAALTTGATPVPLGDGSIMDRRETLEVVRSYYRVPEADRPQVRAILATLGRLQPIARPVVMAAE